MDLRPRRVSLWLLLTAQNSIIFVRCEGKVPNVNTPMNGLFERVDGFIERVSVVDRLVSWLAPRVAPSTVAHAGCPGWTHCNTMCIKDNRCTDFPCTTEYWYTQPGSPCYGICKAWLCNLQACPYGAC
jgi:hypothetical protein